MTIYTSAWNPSEAAGTEEYFLLAKPDGQGSFVGQFSCAFDEYRAALDGLGLSPQTVVTVTIFLSDSANQEAVLRSHERFSQLIEAGAAITVIQQPPVGGKVALQAYHTRRPAGSFDRKRLAVGGAKTPAMGISISTDAYQFVYLKNLLSARGGDAGQQTEALLAPPHGLGQCAGLELSEVVRTWLYISDIDRNYGAVSEARNRVFDRHGLSPATGFPASTGINGRSSDACDLLAADVFAIKGLQGGQNRRLEALTHMNRTVDYGVTFERGREVIFGDRRHLYVSGTASISNDGRILYEGDVARQTERAVENVQALLGSTGSKLSDMRHVIVYLRDAADAAAVEAVMRTTPLAATPTIMVHAAVCRPGWLVELEGIAIDGKGSAQFAPF